MRVVHFLLLLSAERKRNVSLTMPRDNITPPVKNVTINLARRLVASSHRASILLGKHSTRINLLFTNLHLRTFVSERLAAYVNEAALSFMLSYPLFADVSFCEAASPPCREN